MKPTPEGWPRITAAIYYEKPKLAIDWLCRAFGFKVRLKIEGEGDAVEHSELTFGSDGLVMVGTVPGIGPQDEKTTEKYPWKKLYTSPQLLGGKNTQSLALFVDDVDNHCERARAAGAKIFREPETNDYGEDYWTDRTYGALDLEGHQWWFMQRLRG